MENADKHPAVDWKCKKQHFERAMLIREELEKRLKDEPVFQRMRATHDSAERRAPPLPSIAALSLADRKRMAREKLMAGLKSTKSEAPAIFNNSVPTAPNERAIRAIITGDVARADYDNFSTSNYTTKLSVHIRAHNAESFAKRQKNKLQDSVLAESNETSFVATVRLRLKKETPRDDIKWLMMFVEKEMCKSREKLEVRVKDEADGFKHAYITFADYRGHSDPIAGIIQDIVRNVTGLNRSKMERVPLSDIVRAATLNFELPRDLSKLTESDSVTWMSLTEGMRVAAEVIVRDNVLNQFSFDLMTAAARGSSKATMMLVAGAGFMMSKDITVRMNIAPAELAFAQAVRELSALSRAIFTKNAGELAREARTLDADETKESENITNKTYFEEGWGNLFAQTTAAGATPAALKSLGLGMIGGQSLRRHDDSRGGESGWVTDKLVSLLHWIDKVESVDVLLPSSEVTVDAARSGVGAELIHKVLPRSRQELVDNFAKPYGIAMAAARGDDFIDLVSRVGSRGLHEYPDLFNEMAWFPRGSFVDIYENECKIAGAAALAPTKRIHNSGSGRMIAPNTLSAIQLPRPIGGRDEGKSKVRSSWDFGGVPAAAEKTAMGVPAASSGGMAARIKSDNPEMISSSADLPAEKLRYLQGVFSQFDFSGDGRLDKAELMACCCANFPHVPATDIYGRLIKLGNSSSLTFEDFVQLTKYYI